MLCKVRRRLEWHIQYQKLHMALQNLLLLKSYNVPELTKNAVPLSAEEITKTVVDDAAIKGVNYK